MSYRIGQDISAVVSGLSQWGIYLEDEHSKSEGLIRFKDLGSEFFEFDEKQYVAKGSNGTIIRIGDVFKVRVVAADMEEKTIDYRILEKTRSISPAKRVV
jgi:ribonuclease R